MGTRRKSSARKPARSRPVEVQVTDWLGLQRELYGETWNENIQRFRSDFVYRGMGDASWDLHTSLSRLGGNFRELEGHLLRNFKKYAGMVWNHPHSEWNWLALAQHHGLPTRLLDWTYSPYTALHFATVNLDQYDCDAVIWCVNFVKAHALLPAELKKILQAERSNAFTPEMLDRRAKTLYELERLGRDFVVFFEPPSMDERIVNQYALFSMMSDPDTQLDEWLSRQSSDLLRRVIIPKELKWEARDKLDQANITERVLFPGLDGLSQWLRRHYTPRRDQAKRSSRELDELSLDPARQRLRGE